MRPCLPYTKHAHVHVCLILQVMVDEVAVRNISWAKLLTPDKRGEALRPLHQQTSYLVYRSGNRSWFGLMESAFLVNARAFWVHTHALWVHTCGCRRKLFECSLVGAGTCCRDVQACAGIRSHAARAGTQELGQNRGYMLWKSK